MTPILFRHFMFGFSEEPSPWSAVYAGVIAQWNADGLPTPQAKRLAGLSASSRNGGIFRSPLPRNHVIMHQCMRDQAVHAWDMMP